MSKFTRREVRQLEEFLAKCDRQGRLSVDQWVSGTGRFTKPKALPPFVERFERGAFDFGNTSHWPHRGTTQRAAFDWFQANPRRKLCLVLDQAAMWQFLTVNSLGKTY